jgi:hypothetical protein
VRRDAASAPPASAGSCALFFKFKRGDRGRFFSVALGVSAGLVFRQPLAQWRLA